MDKELAQFRLDDGTAFLVEVDSPRVTRGGAIQRVAAVDTGEMVLQATQTLEQALDKVKPVASTVISKLKSGLTTPADEVEVTFGLKLNAEAGVVFSSVGGEVTFEVKLKWAKDKG
ncbi:MAG: CU044_2847 family protein [Cyanobacteria bacterium J06635_1]